MNNIFIWIILIFIFLFAGIIIGCLKKSVLSALIFIPGILVILAGIYLSPTIMWKDISNGLLVLGLILEAIAIIICAKRKQNHI